MKTAVEGFAPARNGFHFRNSFPSEPAYVLTLPGAGSVLIGDAANGLCGGMAFAARDFFEHHMPPPTDETPPQEGSPLFMYLVDRLVDSFDLPQGPPRYFQWMSLPDEDSWFGRGVWSMTVREEWPKARHELDRRHLCPLGLVRVRSLDPRDLGRNHQVLAYAYDLDETSGRVTLFLYDPNWPGSEVTLSFGSSSPAPQAITYSTGETVRGFFLSRYTPADPRFLLDPSAPQSVVRLSWIAARLKAMFGH